jgi:hypothetical protein
MREFGHRFLRGTLEDTHALIVTEIEKYRKMNEISADLPIKINLLPDFGGADLSKQPPVESPAGLDLEDLRHAPLTMSARKPCGREKGKDISKFHGYSLFLKEYFAKHAVDGEESRETTRKAAECWKQLDPEKRSEYNLLAASICEQQEECFREAKRGNKGAKRRV